MFPVLGKKYTYISLGYKEKYKENFPIEKLRGKVHYGVDITPKWGYKQRTFYLVAPVSGTIIYSDWYKNWGKRVKIQSAESDKGCIHICCHLAKLFYKPGRYVRKGQPIGIMGNTGWSTAKHLHYEVKKKIGGKWRSIDPSPYLT